MTDVAALFWAPMAVIGGASAHGVLIEVEDGIVESVSTAHAAPPDATVLDGAVIPGMVDAHSHVFHRALRGHPDAGGDFWGWRSIMYRLANRLDPDSFERLATATFAEMLASGVTAVGEFHYLHHGPGGVPYGDPNEMAMALVRAADAAGIRLCLLDTCYLMASIDGRPLEGAQLRFGDGDGDRWAVRHADLADRLAGSEVIVGSAIHSVRAVPPVAFETVAAGPGPTHVHVSEQPAENAACAEVHGSTPAGLLAENGGLGPSTTVVHAVHVTANDLDLIATSGGSVCVCPTTELDLGDGTADVLAMSTRGIDVALGSDSHVVIDLMAEARLVEWNDRSRHGRRGVHPPAALWEMATSAGARSLGFGAWGITPGCRADFAVVGLDRMNTAGVDDAVGLLAAASGSDVIATVVGGVEIVRSGEHRTLGAIAERLSDVLREVAV